MYKSFFLDTTNMTEPKLYIGHWMVTCQVILFYMDWKSKMASSRFYLKKRTYRKTKKPFSLDTTKMI